MNIGIKDLLKDKDKLKLITRAAFDAVDKDKSGYLEANELEEVMNTIAKDIGVDKPSKEEVEEVLKELDEYGDGRMSLEQFQLLI